MGCIVSLLNARPLFRPLPPLSLLSLAHRSIRARCAVRVGALLAVLAATNILLAAAFSLGCQPWGG